MHRHTGDRTSSRRRYRGCAKASPACGVILMRVVELGHKGVACAPGVKAIVLADSSLIVGGRSPATKLSTGTRQAIVQGEATIASLTGMLREHNLV